MGRDIPLLRQENAIEAKRSWGGICFHSLRIEEFPSHQYDPLQPTRSTWSGRARQPTHRILTNNDQEDYSKHMGRTSSLA